MASPEKANTRTPAQRERDRAYVAERYLRGVTQAEIAAHLGLSRQQITYDLKLLQTRWRASSLRDFDTARSEELKKVDELERTYWVAWERSLQERTITSTKRVDAGAGPAATARAEAQLRKEQRDGNPAYLSGVQWCIERRCALLGLDAPQRLQQTMDASERLLDALRSFGRGEDDLGDGDGNGGGNGDQTADLLSTLG